MTRIPIVILLLLASCVEKVESQIKVNEPVNLELVADSLLLDYFEDNFSDSLFIFTDRHDSERLYTAKECLPIRFKSITDTFYIRYNIDGSRLKPLSKTKLSINSYFLTIATQDDYGPVYYGMLYSTASKRITQITNIAWTWGDAGDSQSANSIILKTKTGVTIESYIKTCHHDIFDGLPIINESNCNDSISKLILELK